MIMTVVSMIAGIIFAKVITSMGRAALPIILVLNVIGFYILSAATSFPMILVAAVFIGMGFGLLMPYGTLKVTLAAPPAGAVFANGLYMTFVNIGTAVSPTILVAVGKGFNNPDGQFIFFCCAVVLVVGVVLSIILSLTQKKPETENAVK